MPTVKVKGGWKIKRVKGGTYPKIYKTRKEVDKRIAQLEKYK
jgi:hypothetical protein